MTEMYQLFQFLTRFYLLFYPLTSVTSDHFQDERSTMPPYRMPPGFLPRVVNMEMSWYGISQDHPLAVGSKNAKASKLMTENTVGRPHLIFQSGMPPIPPRLPRQLLAERGAKYLLSENEANKILFKFIRDGGMGDSFTIRRVITLTHDTTHVINKGRLFACKKGVPVTEGHLKFAMFNCSEEGAIEPLEPNIDICAEGEDALQEYCEEHDWVLCMGSNEATNDTKCHMCGGRLSVILSEFYDMCAIDENIVIWYNYYGEIPLKYKTSQLCTREFPCTVSYLYRLEAPWGPHPTPKPTTMDPCKTSICPECAETTESTVEASEARAATTTPGPQKEEDQKEVPTTTPTTTTVKA